MILLNEIVTGNLPKIDRNTTAKSPPQNRSSVLIESSSDRENPERKSEFGVKIGRSRSTTTARIRSSRLKPTRRCECSMGSLIPRSSPVILAKNENYLSLGKIGVIEEREN